MESVNRQVVRERISLVIDTLNGSRADEKGLKAHIKSLTKSVGLEDNMSGNIGDFMRDFGGKGL